MLERVETERLLLRKPESTDAPRIFERYASDPVVTRLLGWPRHTSEEHTVAFLKMSDEHWARWPAGPYLIEARQDGRLLGATGLEFESAYCAVTGYVLARDAWGNGYATEALRSIIGIAQQAGLKRLHALVHPGNLPSIRVLEKAGFRKGDLLKRHVHFPNLGCDEPQDVLRYQRELWRPPL